MTVESVGDLQRLRYEIKNRKPVDATTYAQAMIALEDEYVQFMALHVSATEQEACRLIVGSVRDGSIITILAPAIAGTLPLLDTMMSITDYATYLKSLFDWARGEAERPKLADERKTLKNISNIVRPTVHDQGAQMNIGTITVNGDVTVNVTLAETQAQEVLGFARKRLADTRKSTEMKDREGVLFYWASTSSKVSTKAGDKGKIDEISDRAVSVSFADESIKQRMVLDEEFIYRKAYVVDVRVHTAHDDKIALYTILRLIEIIDIE